MHKLLFILTTTALVFGCSPGVSRKEPPKKLLKEEKMVEVMTELMKLEGHANVKYLQVTKYYKLMQTTGDSLFKAKGITAKQYEESFDYYAQQQYALKRIYEKVLNNLNHEMTQLELEQQKQQKADNARND